MPPSAGLIAGAVGGGIASLLGSSQYQVSGPAAALTLMVLGLAKDFGTSGVAAEYRNRLARIRTVPHLSPNVYVGANTNVRHGLVMHPLKDKRVSAWSACSWAQARERIQRAIVSTRSFHEGSFRTSWNRPSCGSHVLSLLPAASKTRFAADMLATGSAVPNAM